MCRVSTEYPAQMALFLNKLPAELELDQPVPDVDLVIDILLRTPQIDNTGGESNGRGVKRGTDALDLMTGGQSDIFTMRRKLRTVN